MRLFFVPVSLAVVIILSSVSSSQEPIHTPKFKLAESYEKAGKYEEAARLYEDLYQGQPGNHVYFEGLSRVYLKLKRYNDAISLLQKRLTISPGDVNLRGKLGSVYYNNSPRSEPPSLLLQQVNVLICSQIGYTQIIWEVSYHLQTATTDRAGGA